MLGLQDLMTFDVDFNNIDAEGLLKGTLRHASGYRIPDVGERVVVRDGEGNACSAVVVRVDGQLVRFELHDATWVSEDVRASGVPTSPRPIPIVVTEKPLALA